MWSIVDGWVTLVGASIESKSKADIFRQEQTNHEIAQPATIRKLL